MKLTKILLLFAFIIMLVLPANAESTNLSENSTITNLTLIASNNSVIINALRYPCDDACIHRGANRVANGLDLWLTRLGDHFVNMTVDVFKSFLQN